jgi:hypothetical protein
MAYLKIPEMTVFIFCHSLRVMLYFLINPFAHSSNIKGYFIETVSFFSSAHAAMGVTKDRDKAYPCS